MTIAQGTDPVTKLRLQLRTMRAKYVQRQRLGLGTKDTGQLAAFDAQLEKLNANANRLHPKRQEA